MVTTQHLHECESRILGCTQALTGPRIADASCTVQGIPTDVDTQGFCLTFSHVPFFGSHCAFVDTCYGRRVFPCSPFLGDPLLSTRIRTGEVSEGSC